MGWNYRAYGTVVDPIHKSHLVTFTGDYGCPRRFRYQRDAESDPSVDERTHGYAALGTATHEVIEAALAMRDMGVALASQYNLERSLRARMHDADGAGLIKWADDDDVPALIAERARMLVGLIPRLHDRIARVIAAEIGFIAPFGGYWLSGHIDLLYEPRIAPGTIAMADWKTSAQKPHELELAHGWEAGIYSAALRHGRFVSALGKSRAQLEAELIAIGQAWDADTLPTYGRFPSAIHHVHLGDYVPYAKAGSKRVHRPEDLAYFGYTSATQHKYKAGELRGGAWCPVRLSEADLPRLATRLRDVVGIIRLGRFFDRPGENCTRCAYARPCLNSGYAPDADTQRGLMALAKLDPQGPHT